jgi:hypothetical protein
MRGEQTAKDLRRALALFAKARATEERAILAFEGLTETLFSELSAREWRGFHDHNSALFERMIKAKRKQRNAFEIATMIHALKILEGRTC